MSFLLNLGRIKRLEKEEMHQGKNEKKFSETEKVTLARTPVNSIVLKKDNR